MLIIYAKYSFEKCRDEFGTFYIPSQLYPSSPCTSKTSPWSPTLSPKVFSRPMPSQLIIWILLPICLLDMNTVLFNPFYKLYQNHHFRAIPSGGKNCSIPQAIFRCDGRWSFSCSLINYALIWFSKWGFLVFPCTSVYLALLAHLPFK